MVLALDCAARTTPVEESAIPYVPPSGTVCESTPAGWVKPFFPFAASGALGAGLRGSTVSLQAVVVATASAARRAAVVRVGSI
jgi:hypothetical protein